jgi:hypothetical protein
MSIETIRQTDTGEALYHEMIELGDAARAASQALARRPRPCARPRRACAAAPTGFTRPT